MRFIDSWGRFIIQYPLSQRAESVNDQKPWYTFEAKEPLPGLLRPFRGYPWVSDRYPRLQLTFHIRLALLVKTVRVKGPFTGLDIPRQANSTSPDDYHLLLVPFNHECQWHWINDGGCPHWNPNISGSIWDHRHSNVPLLSEISQRPLSRQSNGKLTFWHKC